MNQFRIFVCSVGMIAVLAGCRAPQTFDPFAPNGPTRIPPPSTGAIGSAARSYDGGVSTAQRTSASTFGTPGQARPDLGTGTAAPPEDRGWSNPASPGAPASAPAAAPPAAPAGAAPVGPTGNPFGQTTPQSGTSGQTTLASRTPLPDVDSSATELNWLDPRQRTSSDGELSPVNIPASDEIPAGYADGYQLAGARARVVPRLTTSAAAADPLNDFSSFASGADGPDDSERLASSGPRLHFSGSYGATADDVRMSSTDLPSQR
ncbi:MAG: hypothetical protein U0795_08435 [Pirellulales bacterium]